MPARPHVAIVSCRELPVPAPDDALLVDALGAEGITASIVAWDDDLPWESFTACVLRSPWDYTARVDEFLAWVTRTGEQVPVWNPPAVIAANAHKRYLLALADRGVPVVPTTLVEQGATADLAALLATHGEVVVKPAVSAGARETHRAGGRAPFTDADLARLLTAGDVLVQPFLASIATRGETAVAWIDGGPSHAWHKLPAPGDFRVQEEHGGVESPAAASPAELEVAAAAMATVDGHDVLYARVDLVEWEGEPHVMELELIEPDLRLRDAPRSLAWFAGAIARRLGTDE
ncbi:MAG TPA: hypothetical protein VK866_03380 [Acidimicrobiales bacterium]|nr:hypothetical protein [Acidimicrobiales bacterium]